MNMIPPAKGDKVSFISENSGDRIEGRVRNVLDGFVYISKPRQRHVYGGGYYKVPLAKVTIEQRQGQVDPRQHSEKGLETLAAMKTVPTDWGLAEIKWFKKIVTIDSWTPCPVCQGDGEVGTLKDKVVPRHQAWNGGASETIRLCDKCPRVKYTKVGRLYRTAKMTPKDFSYDDHHGAAHTLGYHEMNGLVPAKFRVERQWGVVQWAKDTRFDSRFAQRWGETSGHKECELCAKAIPSGLFVPVTGKGQDGVVHGAWIGQDCARKFFGIKNFKDDQIIQTPEAK